MSNHQGTQIYMLQIFIDHSGNSLWEQHPKSVSVRHARKTEADFWWHQPGRLSIGSVDKGASKWFKMVKVC